METNLLFQMKGHRPNSNTLAIPVPPDKEPAGRRSSGLAHLMSALHQNAAAVVNSKTQLNGPDQVKNSTDSNLFSVKNWRELTWLAIHRSCLFPVGVKIISKLSMTFSRTWKWPEFIEFQSGHWKTGTLKIIVYILVDHFARAGKFGKILSLAKKSAVAALASSFCKQSLKKTKYTRNWVWNHIIFALIYENLLQILPAEEYTTCKRNGCVKLRQEESGLGSEEPISVPTLLQDAAAAYPDVSTHLFPKELYFEGYRKVGKERGSSFWFRTSLWEKTSPYKLFFKINFGSDFVQYVCR